MKKRSIGGDRTSGTGTGRGPHTIVTEKGKLSRTLKLHFERDEMEDPELPRAHYDKEKKVADGVTGAIGKYAIPVTATIVGAAGVMAGEAIAGQELANNDALAPSIEGADDAHSTGLESVEVVDPDGVRTEHDEERQSMAVSYLFGDDSEPKAS